MIKKIITPSLFLVIGILALILYAAQSHGKKLEAAVDDSSISLDNADTTQDFVQTNYKNLLPKKKVTLKPQWGGKGYSRVTY